MNINDLIDNKPTSIRNIIPSEFYTRLEDYDYIWSQNYYEWCYAIAKTLKPRTFLEIGVRFGFSFLPFLEGNPDMEYALGWDLETYGSNSLTRSGLNEYYRGTCRWDIQHIDSQLQPELPQFFDLVNIDGCHDYECKQHDLNIASRNSRYVYLDDYDYHPHVRQSVNDWMRNNTEKIEWALYIPTFRGSQLIKWKL